jgi:hypothetical protein
LLDTGEPVEAIDVLEDRIGTDADDCDLRAWHARIL